MDRNMQSCYKRLMLPLMLGKEDFARRENGLIAPRRDIHLLMNGDHESRQLQRITREPHGRGAVCKADVTMVNDGESRFLPRRPGRYVFAGIDGCQRIATAVVMHRPDP